MDEIEIVDMGGEEMSTFGSIFLPRDGFLTFFGVGLNEDGVATFRVAGIGVVEICTGVVVEVVVRSGETILVGSSLYVSSTIIGGSSPFFTLMSVDAKVVVPETLIPEGF